MTFGCVDEADRRLFNGRTHDNYLRFEKASKCVFAFELPIWGDLGSHPTGSGIQSTYESAHFSSGGLNEGPILLGRTTESLK
jgi:hypothetical protein